MPNITMFLSYADVDNPNEITLIDYLECIRIGTWEDSVHLVRRCKRGSDEQKKVKSLTPGVCFSGTFSSRRDDSILNPSGYICIDIDDVEDPETLKDLLQIDRYVYAIFTSISGYGLKVLFRINPAKFKESYYGIAAYLLRTYDIVPDPQSGVLSRSQLVSYDPHIYLNKNQTFLFTEYIKETKIDKKELTTFVYEEDDFKDIMQQLNLRKLNLCESYSDWVRIGFSLAHKFGAEGEQYFHLVSSFSEKYKPEQCKKQYQYILKHKSGDNVTIATFYWYCQKAGIQTTSERTSMIKKETLIGKGAGLKKEQIVTRLLEKGVDKPEQLVDRVWEQSGTLTYGDTTVEQLEMYISTNYSIRRNILTRRLELHGKPMEDIELNSIYIAALKINSKVTYGLIEKLLLSSFIPQYNPIVDYLRDISKVKGLKTLPPNGLNNNHHFKTPLMDKLCATIQNDEPEFTNFFVKKWIVSIVSSAFGLPSPLVLVLLGPQNTGKTEWFRRLFPAYLKPYYGESRLDAGRDDDILMTQKLLIVDDEFGGKSKREEGRFKEITAKEIFSLREPYGRANVDLKRLAVMGGTSNHKEVLSDPTGNRRIIPVFVKDIDKTAFNAVDKEAMFAEATRVLSEGFDWRINSFADVAYLNKDEVKYEVAKLEYELLAKFFSPHNSGEQGEVVHLTASEIKVEVDTITNQRLSLDSIGKSLSKLGFTQKSVREKIMNGVETTKVSKKWFVIRTSRPKDGYVPPPNSF
jgi:hypothetical protein